MHTQKSRLTPKAARCNDTPPLFLASFFCIEYITMGDATDVEQKTIFPKTFPGVRFGVFKMRPRPHPTATVIPGEITPGTPLGTPCSGIISGG